VTKMASKNQNFGRETPYEEQVVKVFRCSTVVKGGRRFSFAALVVVGDRHGKVGMGYGKANEVQPAIEKGIKAARRELHTVNLLGTSIPHQVTGRFGATKVLLAPASDGTGVIAGKSVRAVLELAGVKNVLTKVYGSTGPKNVVKATILALCDLHSTEQIETLRNVKIQA